MSKILATFRIDPEEWEAFKTMAAADGSNASSLLMGFVRSYLSGNKPNTNAISTPTSLDTSWSSRLDTIESRLDDVNNINLDNLASLIDKRIDTRLDEMRSHLESQLEELRGKLKAR